MKIGIIGGGAIGLLLSSYFSRNHEVTIYTRTKNQADDLSNMGLYLIKDQYSIRCQISATPFPNRNLSDQDLLIIAVKQYQLNQVIPQLMDLNSKMLFVQNGMGHLEFLETLQVNNDVYVGIVEHGAMKNNSYTVTHTGNGKIKIASYSGNPISLQYLETDSSFPIVFEKEYKEMLTKKLVVNALINPLTAVLGVTNGSIIDNPHYQTIFNKLFSELSTILEFENKQEIRSHVENICMKTAKNRSSMLSDIEEHRTTEIDAILGYILDIANKKQLNVPITENLYLMVKGKELQGKEK